MTDDYESFSGKVLPFGCLGSSVWFNFSDSTLNPPVPSILNTLSYDLSTLDVSLLRDFSTSPRGVLASIHY